MIFPRWMTGAAFGLAYCASALVTPTTAIAQQQGAAAQSIEEVVVTARRRAETAQNVPIPITALSGADLNARNISELKDIERLTPGLNFHYSSVNRATSSIGLRGIGQVNWSTTQDPKVGVYLNGVYLARPQGQIFDLFDIDRVEVLRGPQGTLYGRNTTAGLIHVVTKKPQPELDYGIRLGLANYSGRTLDGMLNLPLGEDLSLRVSGQLRKADGYVENTETGKDWNDTNNLSARATLAWKPSEALAAHLSMEYFRSREHPSLGNCEWFAPESGAAASADPKWGIPALLFVLGTYDQFRDDCNATRPYKSFDNDPDESEVDLLASTLTVEADLELATLTSITALRTMEDINGSWGGGGDRVGGPSYIEVVSFERAEYEQFSQELRLAGSADRLDWTAGLYYFTETATNPISVPFFRNAVAPTPAQSPLFYLCIPNATVPVPHPCAPGEGPTFGALALGAQRFNSRNENNDAENSSWAVFFEGIYKLNERFSLTGGYRFTRDDREVHRRQTLTDGSVDPGYMCRDGEVPSALAPVDSICFQSADFSEDSYRLIGDYKLRDDVLLYGSYSRGYSSGGFNSDANQRVYEPETSDNLELGFKSHLLDRRLRWNTSLFYNMYKNQQLTISRVVQGQPTADIINAQEALLYGAELELLALLPRGFSVNMNYGYLNGDYEEFVVDDNQGTLDMPLVVERDLSDLDPILSPPHIVNVGVSWTGSAILGGTLNLGVHWRYRDRSYNSVESLDSTLQDSYALLDARARWLSADERFEVTLWATNLTDKEYFRGALDFSGTGTGTALGYVNKYWGEPRRFGLEWTIRPGR